MLCNTSHLNSWLCIWLTTWRCYWICICVMIRGVSFMPLWSVIIQRCSNTEPQSASSRIPEVFLPLISALENKFAELSDILCILDGALTWCNSEAVENRIKGELCISSQAKQGHSPESFKGPIGPSSCQFICSHLINLKSIWKYAWLNHNAKWNDWEVR